MAYTKYHDPWHDATSVTGGGNETTPLVAAALDHIESGIAAAIPADIVDAKGDLIVATAADTVGRLAIGNADEVASVSGGTVLWRKVGNAMIASNAAIDVSKLAPGSANQVVGMSGGAAAWVPSPAASSTSFTPTWGADSGVSPSIGNGTLTGHYTRLGSIVVCVVQMTLGSSSSMGSGGSFWNFGLPLTAASPLEGGGAGYLEDLATTAYAPVTARLLSTTSFVIYSGNTLIYATVPFTWGAGDFFNVSFSYLAA